MRHIGERCKLLAAAAGKIQPIEVELGKKAHDWILKPKRNDELLFTEFEGVDAVHDVPPGIYFAARSNARALTLPIDTAAFNTTCAGLFEILTTRTASSFRPPTRRLAAPVNE